jgi:hypothetical protein
MGTPFDRETYYAVLEEELEKMRSMTYDARRLMKATEQNGTPEERQKAIARCAAFDDLMDAMSGARNPEWQYSRKQEEKQGRE